MLNDFSPLKIKILSENLSRQHCAEGFNSGIYGLMTGKNATFLKY
jgi:hypothetical protein